MTQLELEFEPLGEKEMQVLFMRVLYRAMEEDDCAYYKKTIDLERLYSEHGEAVDHTLIALTGWSFKSLLKFTQDSRAHHLEHYCEGEEDYDPWDVDMTQAL